MTVYTLRKKIPFSFSIRTILLIICGTVLAVGTAEGSKLNGYLTEPNFRKSNKPDTLEPVNVEPVVRFEGSDTLICYDLEQSKVLESFLLEGEHFKKQYFLSKDATETSILLTNQYKRLSEEYGKDRNYWRKIARTERTTKFVLIGSLVVTVGTIIFLAVKK